jgi:hypothetical protein
MFDIKSTVVTIFAAAAAYFIIGLTWNFYVSYRYEPLQSSRQIRVFVLDKRNSNTIITGHFVRQSLDAPVNYDALSYFWGKGPRDRHIICNGKTLRVTKNLYDALNAYRRSAKWQDTNDVPIWADGICINQDDPDEKGQQVRMMGDIYRQAAFVTVWLGEASGDSNLAMDFIGELNRDLTSLRRNSVSMASFENLERYGIRPMSDPAWTALTTLLSRPWFRRIWIVQEAVLGRQVTVSCGTKSVPWDVLTTLLLDHFRACNIPLPQRASINLPFIMMTKRSLASAQKLPLIRLLALTKDFESKEPVDKVFALLGLAKDGSSYLRHVDYKHTAKETFQAIAQTMTSTTHVFEMLSLVRHPKSVRSLPSWVPDWTYQEDTSRSLTVSFYSHGFKATPILAEGGWSHDLSQPQRLTIRGNTIDEITELGPPMYRVWEAHKMYLYKEWDDASRNILSRVSSYPTYESLEDAHWRTRIANLSFKGDFAPASMRYSYAAWREILDIELSKRQVPAYQYQQLDRDSDPFATAQGQAMNGRRFCLTRGGYFGLVPTASRVGDSVGLFTACHVPFVLRPVESSYQLIGECYVHGIMMGEAYQQPGFLQRNLVLV